MRRFWAWYDRLNNFWRLLATLALVVPGILVVVASTTVGLLMHSIYVTVGMALVGFTYMGLLIWSYCWRNVV